MATVHTNDLNIAVSPSSGTFSTTATTPQTVCTTSNLTTTGRPVKLVFAGDNSGTSVLTDLTQNGKLLLVRDVSGSPSILTDYNVPLDSVGNGVPFFGLTHIDTSVPAGNHTWSIQAYLVSGGGQITVNRYTLTAYEM